MPFVSITEANVDQTTQLLNLDAGTEQEIESAVRQTGATVLTPQRNVVLGTWTGAGYVVDEGESLHYRISGGLNGGVYNPDLVTPVAIDFAGLLADVIVGGAEVFTNAVVAIASVMAPTFLDVLECYGSQDDKVRTAQLMIAFMAGFQAASWAQAIEGPILVAGKVMPRPHFAILLGVTALSVTMAIMASISCSDLRYEDEE